GSSSVQGEVTENNCSDAFCGIFDLAARVHVSSNTVTSTGFGILLLAGGTVQSNDIANSGNGIVLAAAGGNVQSNRITFSTVAAIEFTCQAATVAHNTINDAPIGLNDVPLSLHASITFF